MNKKTRRRPKQTNNLIEIRQRRTERMVCHYDATKQRFVFQRRGRRAIFIYATLAQPVDTDTKVVYTETDG